MGRAGLQSRRVLATAGPTPRKALKPLPEAVEHWLGILRRSGRGAGLRPGPQGGYRERPRAGRAGHSDAEGADDYFELHKDERGQDRAEPKDERGEQGVRVRGQGLGVRDWGLGIGTRAFWGRPVAALCWPRAVSCREWPLILFRFSGESGRCARAPMPPIPVSFSPVYVAEYDHPAARGRASREPFGPSGGAPEAGVRAIAHILLAKSTEAHRRHAEPALQAFCIERRP